MKCVIYLSLMLLLAGCSSQVPLAVNHPISTQLKMKSSHHWDVLANDVAAQTAAVLERDARKDGALKGKPLYLPQAPHASAFDRAFHNFLITRLVNRGLTVSNQRGDGVELVYETQLVHHESSRYAHAPGTLTALSAGVWVVRELVRGSFAAVPGALGLAALADWGLGKFAGAPSKTELIVTTSLARDQKYLLRKSDVYYLDDADGDLFLALNDKGLVVEPALERGVKLMEVVGR